MKPLEVEVEVEVEEEEEEEEEEKKKTRGTTMTERREATAGKKHKKEEPKEEN